MARKAEPAYPPISNSEISIGEASKRAAVSKATINAAIRQGLLSARKAGVPYARWSWAITLESFEPWLAGRDEAQIARSRLDASLSARREARFRKQVGDLEFVPGRKIKGHVHSWAVDPPSGTKSWGTCEECGARRQFANSADLSAESFNA